MRKSKYIGKTINYLTVLETCRKPGKSGYYFKCKCVCGNITLVSQGNLIREDVKSCGCKASEGRSINNSLKLEGETFGRLTVIRKSNRTNNSRSVYWYCSCSCGGSTEASSSNLISGAVKSCGCARHEKNHLRFLVHGLAFTPDYKRVKSKRRRDLQEGLDTEWTIEMEWKIRELFPACIICGKTDEEHKKQYHGKSLHVDHVESLYKGNGLKPGNAVILCQSCNSSKGNKDLSALPSSMRESILTAAALFKEAWDNYVPEVYEEDIEDLSDWEGW